MAKPAILLLSRFKPLRCNAMGCSRAFRDGKKFLCDHHEGLAPKPLVKLLAKHHTELQERHRKVKPEWEAAAYRTVTAVALAEGKITAELAEKREYFVTTKIELKRIEAPKPLDGPTAVKHLMGEA